MFFGLLLERCSLKVNDFDVICRFIIFDLGWVYYRIKLNNNRYLRF